MTMGVGFLIVGFAIMVYGTRRLISSVVSVVVPDKNGSLMETIFMQRKLTRGPAITVVGGGTGLSTLLRGMKYITNNCTAVVTTADDGGSSGRLRKELGIIPPGDLRNCLTALADREPLMERLMQYRFQGDSPLAGHCFGNLFNDPMIRIIFNSAMGKINTYHTPGSMIYGNTIDFSYNMPKNYGAVTSYAMQMQSAR